MFLTKEKKKKRKTHVTTVSTCELEASGGDKLPTQCTVQSLGIKPPSPASRRIHRTTSDKRNKVNEHINEPFRFSVVCYSLRVQKHRCRLWCAAAVYVYILWVFLITQHLKTLHSTESPDVKSFPSVCKCGKMNIRGVKGRVPVILSVVVRGVSPF